MSEEFVDGGSPEPRVPDLCRLPAVAAPLLEQSIAVMATAYRCLAADQERLNLQKRNIANCLLTQVRFERDLEHLRWYQSRWFGKGLDLKIALGHSQRTVADAEAEIKRISEFNRLGDARRGIRNILEDQDPTMSRLRQAKAEVEALNEFLDNVLSVLDRGLARTIPRRQGLLGLLRQHFNSAHDGLQTLAWIENTGLAPIGEHWSVIATIERRLQEATFIIDIQELSRTVTSLHTALVYLDRAASNYVSLVYSEAERLHGMSAG